MYHDSPGKYDTEFYHKDIQDLFERINILMSYKCLPYIMRYKDYKKSPYKGLYNAVSWWCNQPGFFKKMSFCEFCESNQSRVEKECAAIRYLHIVEQNFPDIADKYFDIELSKTHKSERKNRAKPIKNIFKGTKRHSKADLSRKSKSLLKILSL